MKTQTSAPRASRTKTATEDRGYNAAAFSVAPTPAVAPAFVVAALLRRGVSRVASAIFTAALLILAVTLRAADAPVLDLAVSGGIVEDKSSHQRQLALNGIEPANDEKDMLLRTLEAVRIEYAEGDPLFGTEAFTIMIRCKFGNLDPYPAKPFFFVGRWDILEDGRVAGLSFNEKGAGVTFAISQFGDTSEKSLTGVELPELPAGAWIVLVAQYEAGQTLKIQMYNAEGELLGSTKAKFSPPPLYKTQTPFKVGSLPDVQMQIGRVLVWDRCLDEGDVRDQAEKLAK